MYVISNESVLKNDIRTVNLVLFKVLVLVLLLTIQMLIIGTVQVLIDACHNAIL